MDGDVVVPRGGERGLEPVEHNTVTDVPRLGRTADAEAVAIDQTHHAVGVGLQLTVVDATAAGTTNREGCGGDQQITGSDHHIVEIAVGIGNARIGVAERTGVEAGVAANTDAKKGRRDGDRTTLPITPDVGAWRVRQLEDRRAVGTQVFNTADRCRGGGAIDHLRVGLADQEPLGANDGEAAAGAVADAVVAQVGAGSGGGRRGAEAIGSRRFAARSGDRHRAEGITALQTLSRIREGGVILTEQLGVSLGQDHQRGGRDLQRAVVNGDGVVPRCGERGLEMVEHGTVTDVARLGGATDAEAVAIDQADHAVGVGLNLAVVHAAADVAPDGEGSGGDQQITGGNHHLVEVAVGVGDARIGVADHAAVEPGIAANAGAEDRRCDGDRTTLTIAPDVRAWHVGQAEDG